LYCTRLLVGNCSVCLLSPRSMDVSKKPSTLFVLSAKCVANYCREGVTSAHEQLNSFLPRRLLEAVLDSVLYSEGEKIALYYKHVTNMDDHAWAAGHYRPMFASERRRPVCQEGSFCRHFPVKCPRLLLHRSPSLECVNDANLFFLTQPL
jgi:hypothetical protein